MTLLKNATWSKEGVTTRGDIRINKGRIQEMDANLSAGRKEVSVDLSGHYLYPGLINSHDHLEMNLYPRLGNPPYANYLEWANDIYKPKESPIKEIESVDINDRLLWGGLKNLISGVTTVIHHNPRRRILAREKFPVRVATDIAWAHSLGLGKNLAESFPKNTAPFVIHAAEGIDNIAGQEIEKLKRSGLLKSNTVLVHAVAASDQDIRSIREAKSSVVWCPASNYFMFNTTARVDQISETIQVSLGTDSTLTGSSTLLDEITFALNCNLVSRDKIYSMVSDQAASIFNLEKPEIQIHAPADFFCLPIKTPDYIENIFSSSPIDVGMVMIDGDFKLTAREMETNTLPKYSFRIAEKEKRISVDIVNLRKRISRKVSGEILNKNPLWNLIE